jgi:tetratricopeptide (TPR) repeat protein
VDLLDFDGEQMYFDHPVSAEVAALLQDAAAGYGQPEAESFLLRAYFLEPEHLTVLVALYRYFYYRHRYEEAILVADRAIRLSAAKLGISEDWRHLSKADLGRAVPVSMALTRFLLLGLKGAGYLELRLGNAAGALERFDKVIELDASDRLGMKELRALAQAKITEERVQAIGRNVRFLGS